MGACDFSNFGRGTDPREVFRELADQAAWESGHGGYTGTIAEKDSFVLRRREPMTRTEAEVFATGWTEQAVSEAEAKARGCWSCRGEQYYVSVEVGRGDIEANEKWGPAYAVPICEEGDPDRKVIGYLFYGYAAS